MEDSVNSYGIGKIPEEIGLLKQWTYSFSGYDEDLDEPNKPLKRPRHSHYTANGCLAIGEAYRIAVEKKFNYGFYVTEHDPYVVFDIDHIENVEEPWGELPISLVDFINRNPSYAEISPSGTGIRMIYKFADDSVKAELDGSKFFNREKMEGEREAQVNVGPPWSRMTGNPTSWSVDGIGIIALDDLDSPFKLRWMKDKNDLSGSHDPLPTGRVPTVDEVRQALFQIPLDKNLRVQRAFLKTYGDHYSHYDHWLKTLMALHDYAVKSGHFMEALTMANDWSKQDKEAYQGEAEIQAKWTSFNESPNNVSYRTLFRMSYSIQLRWPKPAEYTKKMEAAKMRKQPIKSEYVNFKALLDHFDIKFHKDINQQNIMYVTGDADIMDNFKTQGVKRHYGKYMGKFDVRSLATIMRSFLQENGFTGIATAGVRDHVSEELGKTKHDFDYFKYFFDTPLSKLPKIYRENEGNRNLSTPEFMFECLTIDYQTHDHAKERRLYFSYYKKWLFGFVRNLYYVNSEHMNNCILLLTGKEQIRKTSHFKYMFPSFMRDEVIAMTPHGFGTDGSMRDIAKISCTSRLIVWDELEDYLDSKTESNFKKVIDNNDQTIVDKYEVVPTVLKPVSCYGGTSNHNEFKLGDTGSRRLFHIPVSWVDTGRLDTVNWHVLINNLRREVEEAPPNKPPWLLSEEELEYQRELHSKITAKTNLDLVLEEIYDFDGTLELAPGNRMIGTTSLQKDKSGRFLTTGQVKDEVFKVYQGVKLVALKKTLARMCGRYTKTSSNPKWLKRPNCKVFKGEARDDYGNKPHWLMPPKRPLQYTQFDNVE